MIAAITAQVIPGVDTAIQQAASRGYEAVVIVVVLVAMMVAMAYLARVFFASSNEREKLALAREERMAKRIDLLEDSYREMVKLQRDEARELAVDCRKALDQNTNVVSRLIATLEERACLWSLDKQKELVQEAAEIAAGVILREHKAAVANGGRG